MMARNNQRLFYWLLLSMLQVSQVVAADDRDALLAEGISFYENQDYYKASDVFEELVSRIPDNSSYYHWLGKSYGRIAETASWLTAMSMAKKTRKAFEKAVELDASNLDALEDLMQYYLEAPGFLGGSKKKAGKIREQLLKAGRNPE